MMTTGRTGELPDLGLLAVASGRRARLSVAGPRGADPQVSPLEAAAP